MNLFLRAKHWQLFTLTFGIPILLDIIMMVSIFSQLMLQSGGNPDPWAVIGYMRLFPFIMILFMGTLLGWQWSVAIGLQKMVPASVHLKVRKFKIFFFIPVIYLTLLMVFIFALFSFIVPNMGMANVEPGFILPFLFIFPIHIFSMFCLFYCIYFVAKTLKTVELQRAADFGDFVGEFFLVWFYPIGVWILQPRINQLVLQYHENENIAEAEDNGLVS